MAGYQVTEVTDADWARFEAKVDRSGDCHVWTASRNSKGYGQFGMGGRGGRPIIASRIAWIREYGPIPASRWVLHHCDNPPCVNPRHLFLGDNRTNMADCSSKGRMSMHRAKLSSAQVLLIRGMYRSGQRAADLAAAFRISRRAISNVVAHRTYRTVQS